MSIQFATDVQYVSCRFSPTETLTADDILSGLRDLVARNELPENDVLMVRLIDCSYEQAQLFMEVVGDLVMFGECSEHGVELDLPLERGYDLLALCVTANPLHRCGLGYLYQVVRSSDESRKVGDLVME